MTKLTFNNIAGKLVKDNDVYQVVDNTDLKTLILSKTSLKPGKSTTGHKHENEEIYVFMSGSGFMETDNNFMFGVKAGDIVLVNSNDFHRVHNYDGVTEDLIFLCVFPGVRSH